MQKLMKISTTQFAKWGGGLLRLPQYDPRAPFIIEIDTTLGNGFNSFSLALNPLATYDFDVTWDGNTRNIKTWNDAGTLLEFSSAGVFDVEIRGDFGGFYFNNTGDVLKIINITNTSTNNFDRANQSFYGASNLLTFDNNNIDIFSNCTDLTDAFRDTKVISLGELNLDSCTSLVRFCFNNTKLASIKLNNTSNVTDIRGIYYNCYDLLEVKLFDTTQCDDASQAFTNCRSVQTIPAFDFTNIIYCVQMCFGMTSLTSFNCINTQNVTNYQQTFSGCISLLSSPDISYLSALSCNSMYEGTKMITFGAITTPVVTSTQYMFISNNVLQTFGGLVGAVNLADIEGMFYGCVSLTEITNIGSWDFSKITSAKLFLYGTRLSEANKEDFLVNLDSQILQNAVEIDIGGGVLSSNSLAAIANIKTNYNWIFKANGVIL